MIISGGVFDPGQSNAEATRSSDAMKRHNTKSRFGKSPNFHGVEFILIRVGGFSFRTVLADHALITLRPDELMNAGVALVILCIYWCCGRLVKIMSNWNQNLSQALGLCCLPVVRILDYVNFVDCFHSWIIHV